LNGNVAREGDAASEWAVDSTVREHVRLKMELPSSVLGAENIGGGSHIISSLSFSPTEDYVSVGSFPLSLAEKLGECCCCYRAIAADFAAMINGKERNNVAVAVGAQQCSRDRGWCCC